MIPEKMRAVMAADGKGRVSVETVPVPQPAAGEVLLQMAASPINPSDMSVIDNLSGRDRDYPVPAGREGSGTVVAAGPGLLPRFYLNRRVAVSTYGGAWAEYLAVRAIQCAPLPKKIDFEQGAMALVNPVTVLALVDMAERGGYPAIVNTAAASQLGRMLARVCLKRGIDAIHIVRRQVQVELLHELGAEHVLLSTDPEFENRLRALAADLDATLVLDAVGGDLTGALVRCAPKGSRIVVYGALAEEPMHFRPYRFIGEEITLEGFFLGTWFRRTNPLRALPLIWRATRRLSGDLASRIAARFRLEDAVEAVRSARENATRGKTLFVIKPENNT